MKLTHHDNGTFTLSGLTSDNLSTLSLGLSSLAASEAQASERGYGHAGGNTKANRVFAQRRWRFVEAFGNWLYQAREFGGRGLARRRSTTFDLSEPGWPSDEEVEAANLAPAGEPTYSLNV